MSGQKLRIVALHGYTSNAFMFERRCKAVMKACKAEADFVFLNGPHRVNPITSPAQDLDAPEADQADLSENTPVEEQPRAWWKASDDGDYEGWDATVRSLNEELQKGVVDGVLGFSQGACLAGILAAAAERPERIPALNFHPDQRHLKICIAVGGFLARDPALAAVFSPPIRTPVLHILGDTDMIVPRERSQTLIDVCSVSRVEVHPGGHSLPSQAPWRSFFARFLRAISNEPEGGDQWRALQGPEGEKHTDNDDSTLPEHRNCCPVRL